MSVAFVSGSYINFICYINSVILHPHVPQVQSFQFDTFNPRLSQPGCLQVQELRLQVRALQMVSGLDTSAAGADDSSAPAGGGGGGGSGWEAAPALEAMLVERARRCEHDATVARLAAAAAQGAWTTRRPTCLF